jgi:hypothetical protein
MHRDILYASGVTFGLTAQLSAARDEVINTVSYSGCCSRATHRKEQPLSLILKRIELEAVVPTAAQTDVSRNILLLGRNVLF